LGEGQRLIRRRHVFYVEGYDPQGAEGYYGIFQRTWKRFLKIWPIDVRVGPLTLDSEQQAHWDIEASGPNWRVATRYEFVRQEHFIRAQMAEPLWQQIPRSLLWALDDLISGATFRVVRASWQFGFAVVHFQLMLLTWLLLSLAGGVLAGILSTRWAGLPPIVGVLVGVAVTVGIFLLLRLLADRWFIVQINSHWPYLRAFARGEPTCFDEPIEACAARLVEVARANEVDEILVIGHSGGGALAPAVVARALELDPDVGRHGPRVVLLTLGSIMPGAALHPTAHHLRAVIRRIATEPSVRWIDCQSRKDVLNFWDFDPVAGVGVEVGAERCNPTVWQVRFRDMLKPEFYNRLRWNFFRMHYQFIMANDMRSPYDDLMLLASPLPVEEWPRRRWEAVQSFGPDGTFTGAPGATVPT
jgi:hypothetical protein